jgi:hypothetical protein
MKRYGWPRPPILIAVVLGGILEQSMYASVSAYGFSMLARPQFLAIAAFMLLIVVGSLKVQRGVRQAAASTSIALTSTENTESTQPYKEVSDTTLKKRLSAEVVGEIILLVAVTAFFLYTLLLSFDWPWGARLVPQIAVAIGTPFLILRVIYVLRVLFWTRAASSVAPGQIMDLGFRVGDDPKGEGKRWIRILSAIGILYLGIWLAGFHVALPVWIFVYMFWFGRANFLVAGGIALFFLGLIVGVYDDLIRVPWHDPPLFMLFRHLFSS